MARKLRVEVEGGLYHVIARGNDRPDFFHSDDDYVKFLVLVGKAESEVSVLRVRILFDDEPPSSAYRAPAGYDR